MVFVAAGLLFAGVGTGTAIRQARALAHSHPVSATVVGLDIETHTTNGRGGTTYRPVVRFQYQVDGTTRMGDRVGPLGESHGGHWAWRVLDRYEVGQRVTAWVRDDLPDSAYLEHVSSFTPYYMLSFGVVFAGFSAWLWRRSRRAASTV